MDTKLCSRCKTEKSVEAFAKRKDRPSGLQSQCKECRKVAYGKTYEIDDSIKEKTCSKCEETKPVEQFSHNRSMIGGYNWWCKECSDSRERARYSENIEEERAKGREKSKNPEYRAHRKAYHIGWYADNRKEKLAKNYAWKSENPAYQLEWQRANKEKVAGYGQSRRSKKAELIADLSPEQWLEILATFNHRCAYCGKKKPLHQEHITPVVSGGHYTLHNIVPSCKTCNSKKGKGPPLRPVQPLLLTISEPKKKR